MPDDRDAAVGKHDAAVGDLERHRHVLLDQQDGEAFLAQRGDQVEDLLHHLGRKPERGLVEQQELGPRHQGAGDGEHLLLAARQEAGLLARALAQDRKAVLHLLLEALAFRRAAMGSTAEPQVLGHREAGEDAPAFGHEPDAGARQCFRRQAGDRLAVIEDAAGEGLHQPRNGGER